MSVPAPPIKGVVAGAAEEEIVAQPAGEHVHLGVSNQGVVEIGANQVLDRAVGVTGGVVRVGRGIEEVGSHSDQRIVVRYRVDFRCRR